jgi:pimeloyl-ACP methyl ester carboxylesterase
VNKRTIVRVILVAAALTYFGYSYLKPKPNGAAPARQTMAAIAPNAKAFTLGKLDFKACELTQQHSGATTAAFCTPFSVNENPEDAASRKINLNVALIKSDAERADTDIVVFLAGGPGQAAIENWPAVAGAFAPLRKHHHILLLDQRGTGGSNALTCKPEREKEKEKGADQIADEEANVDVLRRVTRECLAEVQKKADARFYTTTIAVHDLEAVRQALGAPSFDLVGISYGTRMAQQYLMRYPDGVRSMVLDSVVPNELIFGADFAQNLETALKAQFYLCTQTAACAKAFGDPYASLTKLRDALRAKPQDYQFRDPTTFESTHRKLDDYALAGLVRMFAYSPETSALLPLSIAEALKGNYTPLAGQTQLLVGDLSELRDNGMQTSVVCSEDADLLTSRPQDAGTMLGTLLVDAIRTQCEIWPHGTRPADFHTALKTDKPVLLLEGELDPVTPPRYGEQILTGLSNGRLLIAKGQGHNVIGRGCTPKIVEDFVDRLDAKQLDAKCVDALGPMPAFIDFSGSAP